MICVLTPAEIERFYSKIRIAGCGMLWAGPVNNRGYGRFEIYRDGKRIRILAHRLSFMLATGEDPGPSRIRHGCDNPPCVTPDCLTPGTQADNVRDAISRGRTDVSGLAAYRALQSAQVQARIGAARKCCPRCGTTKWLADFHRNRSKADGYQDWCKVCRAIVRRQAARRAS